MIERMIRTAVVALMLGLGLTAASPAVAGPFGLFGGRSRHCSGGNCATPAAMMPAASQAMPACGPQGCTPQGYGMPAATPQAAPQPAAATPFRQASYQTPAAASATQIAQATAGLPVQQGEPQGAARWWTSTTHPGWLVYGVRYTNGVVPQAYRQAGTSMATQHHGVVGAFLAKLNHWRAMHGRHAIGWDQNLAGYAASNDWVGHAPYSTGGAGQCWSSTADWNSSLEMWFNSPAHAAILLSANTAVGWSPCPTGSTANAR